MLGDTLRLELGGERLFEKGFHPQSLGALECPIEKLERVLDSALLPLPEFVSSAISPTSAIRAKRMRASWIGVPPFRRRILGRALRWRNGETVFCCPRRLPIRLFDRGRRRRIRSPSDDIQRNVHRLRL
jgi:hypothetical protein